MRQILPQHQEEVESLEKAREQLILEVGEEIRGYLSDLSDEVLQDEELRKYSSIDSVQSATQTIEGTIEDLVQQGISFEMLRFYLFQSGFGEEEVAYWGDRFMPMEKRYPHLKKMGDDILLEGENGVWIGTMEYMRQNNPEMTNEAYLELLKEHLNTPEKLHIYFAVFMKYRHDRGDFTKLATALKEGESREYTQSPTQTIGRLEDGQMLGDCDDYAFLATEILQRQGENAYTLLIPSHAITVWIEQKNGKWHASTMGTFGLDQNGNRYGWPPDSAKAAGYDDLVEALNSVMEKYDEADLGLPQGAEGYRIHNMASLLQLHEDQTIIWSYDIPVEFLIDHAFVQQLLNIRKLSEANDFEPAFSELMKLKERHEGDVRRISVLENLFFWIFNNIEQGNVSLEVLQKIRIQAEEQIKVDSYRRSFATFYRILREKMQEEKDSNASRAAELAPEIQSLYDQETQLREDIVEKTRFLSVYDYDVLIALYQEQNKEAEAKRLEKERKETFPSAP